MIGMSGARRHRQIPPNRATRDGAIPDLITEVFVADAVEEPLVA